MKIFKPGMTVTMLLVIFMLGFVNVADAAFAGKKSQALTESAAPAATMEAPAAPAADTETLLLVILCFILPPLAVFLKYDDAGTPFIVNLILTLFFWIPGVIHALYHVLK
ncbi:hypothetical protein SDC9_17984 [bioreactor metagenome]|jgi:uncharacterized membrane protein YqaE (UPF0057 family)|uniref:YqaE/Pmp3 family membrane protein n=1 Tax=bioreactor metagenome TaxID=1076179 RepID=A0A644TYZ1_9ZZZZ|nr:YqaE/Pmp3 family membrane protein [Lentimicrobium sp.]MEA5110977.1 YqaE/Pmp3 family membrane protein [Lentimicrobium sp.]